MIKPLTCAAQITLNDPQLSVPTLDLLLWAVTPGAAESPEYDDLLSFLYMKSAEYLASRDEHVKSRAAAA